MHDLVKYDKWQVYFQTHQSSEYAPLSCAAQNLSWCWKKENLNVGLDGDFSKEKKLWQIYQKMHMQLNERKIFLQMNSDFKKNDLKIDGSF